MCKGMPGARWMSTRPNSGAEPEEVCAHFFDQAREPLIDDGHRETITAVHRTDEPVANVWWRWNCSCASCVASCCSAAHSDRIEAPIAPRSGCRERSSEPVIGPIIATSAQREAD